MKELTLRAVAEKALVEWASGQRDLRGDGFATESELESIKSDPLGFADLLKGEDAYDFLHRMLRIEQDARDAEMDAVFKRHMLREAAEENAKAHRALTKIADAANGGIDLWSRRNNHVSWRHHGLFGTDSDQDSAIAEIGESFRIAYENGYGTRRR